MMADPQKPYDAGDQHQVETRAKRVKQAAAKADEDFVQMMDVAAFRAFLWRQLERTHVFQTSADPSPHRTYFLEGERNVGLQLMADVMRLCPERYRSMAEEAKQREDALNG